MIIIKDSPTTKIEITNLDLHAVNLIKSFGRYNYEVDFANRRIIITPEGSAIKQYYEGYGDILNNCIDRIIASYQRHKTYDLCYDDSSINERAFVDEIHLVGVLYIDTIKLVDEYTMKEYVAGNKQKITDENIINDYMRIERSNGRLPKIDRQEIEKSHPDWWVNDNNDVPRQKFPSTLSAVESMGVFIKKDHKICICLKNIEKCSKRLQKCEECDCDSSLLESLVVLHEIGHSVFQFVGQEPTIEPILNETRANYFSSLMTDGYFDDTIYALTKYQPFMYKFPYLSFQFEIYKSKSTLGDKYSILLDDYKDEVGELYGK